MAIINPFSKRQKVLRKEVPDVYKYDEIPHPLLQIAHILRDLFGHPIECDLNSCREAFGKIEELLCREDGRFNLATKPADLHMTADVRVINFLLTEPDHEQVLDVVETAFRFLVIEPRLPSTKLA